MEQYVKAKGLVAGLAKRQTVKMGCVSVCHEIWSVMQ